MRAPAARAAVVALFLTLGGAALAQGEPQITQAQVMAGAAKLYEGQLADLRAVHRLDDNARFGARVATIVRPLIEQAKRDFPESADWPWELHTSSDDAENAFAMAGGKLLVGSAFVDRLMLSDVELAMLLAHEIAHAVLRHNLREAEEALRLEPQWAARPYAELEHAIDHDYGLMRKLAHINFAQEEEADREGMRLAMRAGWKPVELVRFFRKLERHSHSPNFRSLSHPSPAMRLRAAREHAAALEAGR